MRSQGASSGEPRGNLTASKKDGCVHRRRGVLFGGRRDNMRENLALSILRENGETKGHHIQLHGGGPTEETLRIKRRKADQSLLSGENLASDRSQRVNMTDLFGYVCSEGGLSQGKGA